MKFLSSKIAVGCLALFLSGAAGAWANPQQAALLAQARKHQAEHTAQNNAKKAAQLLLQQQRHKKDPEPRDNVVKAAPDTPEQPPAVAPDSSAPPAPTPQPTPAPAPDSPQP